MWCPKIWKLEAQDQGVNKGCLPLRAVNKDLLHASDLISGDFLGIFGVPWLLEAQSRPLPPSSRGILPVYVSVSKFSVFIRTLGISD